MSYKQNIDTTIPMVRIFFHIIGSFAEFDREQIVERASWRGKRVILGRREKDQKPGVRIGGICAAMVSVDERPPFLRSYQPRGF